MTIVLYTSRLEVKSLWTGEKLHHVDVWIARDNCDKVLTANSLQLISAPELHILVWTEDSVDAFVSQIEYKAIIEVLTIIASKARDLVLI